VRFAILWAPAALYRFYRLPIHSAALADRTMIRFAETGEGHLEWDPPHHLLRAGLHDLVLAIDRAGRTVTVLRIYRVR
jgi:hypothetical protein